MSKKIPYKMILKDLNGIYLQQHYFIERHDSMAEKFINVLLVEITCLTLFSSFLIKAEEKLPVLIILCMGVFVILFFIALRNLLCIIRPLSSKAKKENDFSIINVTSKNAIHTSSIYYQGIISQLKNRQDDSKSVVDSYLETINPKRLSEDYAEQIFILAQYSDYKRIQLEKTLKFVKAATLFCIIAILLLLLFKWNPEIFNIINIEVCINSNVFQQ